MTTLAKIPRRATVATVICKSLILLMRRCERDGATVVCKPLKSLARRFRDTVPLTKVRRVPSRGTLFPEHARSESILARVFKSMSWPAFARAFPCPPQTPS